MAAANVAMTASIKVMDMAQDAFSEVAMQLIDTMNAMASGVGGNIDVTA
jgi:hypothetical protein